MNIKRVYIEITNRCNLRCNFCSFHHRELKEMSLGQFEAIIKQIQPYTSYIYLHVQGEPLLHSQFDDILNLCDQYELKVQLVTNGTFLKNYPSLSSHPSLRKLSLSLHSLDFQTCDIHEYMNEVISYCQKHGYVKTITNRRRTIPQINDKNHMVKEFGKRAAMNAPIQGSAADIIKLAMVSIYKIMKEKNVKSKMILQVHDELIFDVKHDEIEVMKNIIHDGMVNVLKRNNVRCEDFININSNLSLWCSNVFLLKETFDNYLKRLKEGKSE